MQGMRLDSKEGLASAWGDVGNARNKPARRSESHAATSVEIEGKATHGLLRAGFRFLRNAAIGLVLLTAVPIAYVWQKGDAVPRSPETVVSRARIADVERLRVLMAPRDESITPMEAGLALRALQSASQHSQTPMRQSGLASPRPWKDFKLAQDMFKDVRAPGAAFQPARFIVELASRGFTEKEMAYLRATAESPLWQDFDRVSAARAVDVIGGLYSLPFSDNAFASTMARMGFADTRELANAGVLRAAYYVAMKQPDRAEASLRSIVGFGFALIDNASTTLDALLGRIIADVGRDGLSQLYMITQAEIPEGQYEALQHQPPDARAFNSRPKAASYADAARQILLNDANNTSLPRGLRLESLSQLSFSSCGNVREMLFGPKPDIRQAFDNAKQSLARYPSEVAFLDLMYESTSRMPTDQVPFWPTQKFVVGAATIASVVLHNPRIASCTRLVTAIQ